MKKIIKYIAISIAGLAIIVAVVYFGFRDVLFAWVLNLPQPRYDVIVERNVAMKTRDGVTLKADIYRPESEGEFPVVVSRVPYGKSRFGLFLEETGIVLAGQGIAFVAQDIRGKHESEGEYYPYINEAEDGDDTIDWTAKQDWSNGNIGMFGYSYFGSTQWLTAPEGNPHLKALVPIVTSQDTYLRWIYNGVYRFNDVLVWHCENKDRELNYDLDVDWDKILLHLPLITADDAACGDVTPYNDWIRHPTPDSYWSKARVDQQVDQIKMPALMIAGWYDYYLDPTIEDYKRMVSRGGSEAAQKSQIIIGPWTHLMKHDFADIDFGEQADFGKQVSVIIDWYHYWLNGVENDTADRGPIHLFVMGRNEWRMEKEWPLKRTVYLDYFLQDDGVLAEEIQHAGKETGTDRFTYNPADPTPTVGGTSIYGVGIAGPVDQKKLLDRSDVLFYATNPLEDEVEVTGPVELVLYASSTAVDTDFTARLIDIFPDGKAINLKDGFLRARYRNSLTEPSFLRPGDVYEFRIKIGAISNVFKKGHRLGIIVGSANFPEFGRNLNTGAEIGMTTEFRSAEQTVFHNQRYPSRLILPVIKE